MREISVYKIFFILGICIIVGSNIYHTLYFDEETNETEQIIYKLTYVNLVGILMILFGVFKAKTFT